MRFVLLLIALLLMGCERRDDRVFQTRGIVRGISPDHRTLDVQHEEIPGYMPTMTMPFALKVPGEAARLKVGDGISFRLLVNDKAALIDHVREIPAREVEVPAISAAAAATSSTPRLRDGDEMPEFSLTNQDDQTLTRETYRGRPFVLTFIFTRCPVPNFCPLMSKNFALLQDAIRGAGDHSLGQTRLLSISFDPEYDSPKVMKDYAASELAAPGIWDFATGTKPEIERLTNAFSVMIRAEGGTLTHGLATALVDGNGRIVEIWRGNAWKPEEIIAALNRLASP